VLLSRWLWRMVDVRVIDRAVEETGGKSVGLARWPLESVDDRRIDKTADQTASGADAGGKRPSEIKPRAIQHHLLVLIAWLVAAILFFYWQYYKSAP